MAKKAKKGETKANAVEITFHGGPRDGKTMQVSNPPPPRLRLAFPEWCNYYRMGDSLGFSYDMDTPWVTVNALEFQS